jgi:hypothetical protein
VQIRRTFLERGGLALRNVAFLDVESLIPFVRHVLGPHIIGVPIMIVLYH